MTGNNKQANLSTWAGRKRGIEENRLWNRAQARFSILSSLQEPGEFRLFDHHMNENIAVSSDKEGIDRKYAHVVQEYMVELRLANKST